MNRSRTSLFVTQDTWLSEICAVLLSLISFLMILVLLKIYDNKPIFVWHGATLNTFISTIATLGKAMLLFTVSACISQWKYIWFSQGRRKLIDFEIVDAASRGPNGSFGLLWNMNFRSLASIGAVITILSLAFDPFVQQIVGIGELQVHTPNSTAIARALRYSRGGINIQPQALGQGRDGRTWNSITTTTDFSMLSSILFGLSNSPSAIAQQMTVRCPGSHCEWQPYQSLAICSSCADVTSSITKSVVNGNGKQTQSDALYCALDPGCPLLFNAKKVTNYTLPNGLYQEDASIPLVSFATTNRSRTVAFQKSELLIFSLTVMKAMKEGNSTSGIPLVATECSLQLCINNYTSEVSNGRIFETAQPLLSVVPTPDWKQELESWGPVGTPGTLATKWVVYPGGTLPDLQLENQFNISQAAINSITQGMMSVLAGKEMNGITGYYLTDPQYTPNSMQLIYEGDLNTIFNGLAMSMSNSLRSDDDNATLVEGTVGITVYNVRMQWIVLPLASVLGGCLLLALTILVTRQGGLPLRKSSALAVLKLGATTTTHLESESTVGEMEKKAKKTFVTLSDKISEHVR